MRNVDMEKWQATGLLVGLAPEKADMIARNLQALMDVILEDKVRYSLLEEKILQLRSEDDILDRDKAIVELYESLVIAYSPVSEIISAARGETYVLSHPVLDKYRDFVERSRM